VADSSLVATSLDSLNDMQLLDNQYLVHIWFKKVYKLPALTWPDN